MPDPEMAAAFEALEAVLIVMLEDAHELAVASAPEAIEARRARIKVLRQAGAEIAVLADACAVLLRGPRPPTSSRPATGTLRRA